MSAALIDPAVMSRIITPIPEKNSARNSSAITSACEPPASGTRISGAGKSTDPTMKLGPIADAGGEAACDHRPDHAADGPDAEHDAERPGRTCSVRMA